MVLACEGSASMTATHTPARQAAALAFLAAAGLLAGCGSSSSPTVTVTVTAPASPTPAASQASPTPASTQGPPGCATKTLTATLGPGSGAAGSVYYPIEFTNASGTTCTLYGYPGVSFVTSSGAQVGAAATEDPTYPRRLVTLAPGATAHAELRITDALNYPSSTCQPAAVHLLRVYPPGQASALHLNLTTTACSSTSVQILSVQTVQPGNGSQ
jgi:Protein of unknown function (DUF4232)